MIKGLGTTTLSRIFTSGSWARPSASIISEPVRRNSSLAPLTAMRVLANQPAATTSYFPGCTSKCTRPEASGCST